MFVCLCHMTLCDNMEWSAQGERSALTSCPRVDTFYHSLFSIYIGHAKANSVYTNHT